MARKKFKALVILPDSIAAYTRKRTRELRPGDVLFSVWEVTAKPRALTGGDHRVDRFMMRVPVKFIETGEESELVLPRRAQHNIKRR